MPYYDDELTDRAARIYHREGERKGESRMTPSRHRSRREGDRIILASGDQTLAVYKVTVREGEEFLVRA